jgi:SPP1 family predicted phage head-tail adaptor
MSAGTLRHRIELQARVSDTRDGFAQQVAAFSTIGTVWAEARMLAGREYFEARAQQGEVSVRFRFRYLSSALATQRVVWDGKAYDVVDRPIDAQGRRTWLEIMAKRVE